jgi:hypothetical protein
MNGRFPLLGFGLLLILLGGSAAAHAATPSRRQIPVWAGISRDRSVAGALVVARSEKGRRLTPPARVSRSGAAWLQAPRRLPRNFVVEVRKGHGRRALTLRASVRDWGGMRVVYVDPFSTVVAAYHRLHPGMSATKTTRRVQRHLGLAALPLAPDSVTFWSQRAFSGDSFQAAAKKRHGLAPYAVKIAHEVDRSHKLHRFPPRPSRHGGKKAKRGGGKGTRNGAAPRVATASASYGAVIAENAEREKIEEEAIKAAKAAVSVATGSPSALVEFGEVLASLLGSGDTAQLKQISSQLESLQIGIDDLASQMASVDAEISLTAYSNAVGLYQPTQETIEKDWEIFDHAVAYATEGSPRAPAEARALKERLSALGESITSTSRMPYDNGSPGLMAWAQNAFAKGQDEGTMTAANQIATRAAGFTWWSFWWKDIILHAEKWANAETAGAMSPGEAEAELEASRKKLEAAAHDEYGEELPESLVYKITSGALYSVGTAYNVEPSLARLENGPKWEPVTLAEANALPSKSTGLLEAMLESLPEYPNNPNASMEGIFGTQPNDGTWPTYKGTGGGYGIPPETELIEEPTHMLALAASPGAECEGRWQWYTNGQGASDTTGAPIIRLCPALNLLTGNTVPTVCVQVMNPGVFYGWSEDFPAEDWNGIWRHEKAIEFKTCNDVDYWQNAAGIYAGLNWGDGVFQGDSPLSTAIITSDSPSAYYALWSRQVTPRDDFLVGPVTESE